MAHLTAAFSAHENLSSADNPSTLVDRELQASAKTVDETIRSIDGKFSDENINGTGDTDKDINNAQENADTATESTRSADIGCLNKDGNGTETASANDKSKNLEGIQLNRLLDTADTVDYSAVRTVN